MNAYDMEKYDYISAGPGFKHLRTYLGFSDLKKFCGFLKENNIKPFCDYKNDYSIYECIRQIEKGEPFHRTKRKSKIKEKTDSILNTLESLLKEKERKAEELKNKDSLKYQENVDKLKEYKNKLTSLKTCIEDLFYGNGADTSKPKCNSYINI